jgi:hypothetical protein
MMGDMKRDMEQGAGTESGLAMKAKMGVTLPEANKALPADGQGVRNWGKPTAQAVGGGFKLKP